MKFLKWTCILLALCLLVPMGIGLAQMPHIVQGKFLNPDLSKPVQGEIKFQAYLSKSPVDTTAASFCGAEGAWGVEVIYAEKINNAKWVAGDTLVVVYENVKEGPFLGARTILKYVTTVDSPEDVGNIALPVEMTSFAVSVRSTSVSEEVVLEWRTAGESNNLGFEVQRSMDGKSFTRIGFVAGAGSTQTAQGYTFVDRDVTVARYTYRLKQLDRDGTFAYSDTREVMVAAPERYELSQNFPNPFNPRTEIVFRVRQEGVVVLKVFDLLGREVQTLVNGKLPAGTHRVAVDGRDLPSGMYLYTLSAGNFRDIKKMVLVK